MSILKIGISSRALFDLGESHEIFKKEGIEEYSNYQQIWFLYRVGLL